MREIKFRAWRSDFEEMIYNEFHITADGAVYSFGLAPECVLMQFTGLLDKNGKEIYEGDIVKTDWQHDGTTNYDYEIIGWVVWFEAGLQYYLESKKEMKLIKAGLLATNLLRPLTDFDREQILEQEGYEVIGNIYENPELMEVTL
jgi:uncharacterized phage protein (TIGR01671 family)